MQHFMRHTQQVCGLPHSGAVHCVQLRLLDLDDLAAHFDSIHRICGFPRSGIDCVQLRLLDLDDLPALL